MEIISLIIMAIGLVALLVIYLISRLSRKNLPHNRKLPPIHTVQDEYGNEKSSIAEDHPARDGKTPNANAKDMADLMGQTPPKSSNAFAPSQLILFIAADEAHYFSGSAVLEALDLAGLTYGDMHVYHRLVLTAQGEQSLFYVANGVKPWTLVPEEMAISQTPGLSMILNLPCAIPNPEAIHDFVHTAQLLNTHLGGILKDQHQNSISDEALNAYLHGSPTAATSA